MAPCISNSSVFSFLGLEKRALMGWRGHPLHQLRGGGGCAGWRRTVVPSRRLPRRNTPALRLRRPGAHTSSFTNTGAYSSGPINTGQKHHRHLTCGPASRTRPPEEHHFHDRLVRGRPGVSPGFQRQFPANYCYEGTNLQLANRQESSRWPCALVSGTTPTALITGAASLRAARSQLSTGRGEHGGVFIT